MLSRTDVLDQGGGTVRIWVGMSGLSVLCHVLFFLGVVFLPELQFAGSYIPSAVEVNLVSLPQVESEPQAGADQVSASPKADVKGAPIEPVKSAEEPKPPKPVKELESVKPKEEPVQAMGTKPEEAPEKRVSIAPRPLQVKRSRDRPAFWKIISPLVIRPG